MSVDYNKYGQAIPSAGGGGDSQPTRDCIPCPANHQLDGGCAEKVAILVLFLVLFLLSTVGLVLAACWMRRKLSKVRAQLGVALELEEMQGYRGRPGSISLRDPRSEIRPALPACLVPQPAPEYYQNAIPEPDIINLQPEAAPLPDHLRGAQHIQAQDPAPKYDPVQAYRQRSGAVEVAVAGGSEPGSRTLRRSSRQLGRYIEARNINRDSGAQSLPAVLPAAANSGLVHGRGSSGPQHLSLEPIRTEDEDDAGVYDVQHAQLGAAAQEDDPGVVLLAHRPQHQD